VPAFLTPPAATTLARVDPGRTDALTEPTLDSAWQAVTRTAIGDELLEWPPDLLALTEVILERSRPTGSPCPHQPTCAGRQPASHNGPTRSPTRPGNGAPEPRTLT